VLVGSIAGAAGTDPYGNPYNAGFQIYGSLVTDWNTTQLPGFYAAASTATNGPAAAVYSGVTFGWPTDSGTTQLVSRLTTGDAPELWMRNYQISGGFKTWHRVYDDITVSSGAITAGTGATVVSYTLRRVGKLVFFYGTFTTPAITVGATGNITNTTLGTITDTRFQPLCHYGAVGRWYR
jgi:hypothetical protein